MPIIDLNDQIGRGTPKIIGEIIGLQRNEVYYLQNLGVFKNCVTLGDAILAYCRYLRDGPDDQLELDQEQAKLARSRREKIELDISVRRGELLERDAVRRDWATWAGRCREKLLTLPSALASVCAGMDARTIQQHAHKMVCEALDELSRAGD